MVFMSRKKALNLVVPEDLLRQFDVVAAAYGHGKQKGMVLAAALAMFLDAPAERQGAFIELVMQAEIRHGVTKMKDHTGAQQSLEQATRDALRMAFAMPLARSDRQRLAAKKRGRSKRAFKK